MAIHKRNRIRMTATLRSQHSGQRIAFEQVALLDIGGQRGVAFVPSELLQLGRMDAPVARRVHRAAFERMAAEHILGEAGGGAAQLDDARDRAGIERLGADRDLGAIAALLARPDPPEHRAVGDPGHLEPAAQGPDRAEVTLAIGNADGDAGEGAVAFRERQRDAVAVFRELEMFDREAGELGPTERAGEAHHQQRAVAQAAAILADRRQDLAQDIDPERQLLRGRSLRSAASRLNPLSVAVTIAASVGAGSPAAWWR